MPSAVPRTLAPLIVDLLGLIDVCGVCGGIRGLSVGLVGAVGSGSGAVRSVGSLEPWESGSRAVGSAPNLVRPRPLWRAVRLMCGVVPPVLTASSLVQAGTGQ